MQAKIWLAGALGALLVSTAASAQQLELNFGTVNDPGGMQYQSAEEWAKRVNAALGDQAKVDVYGSSQLGSDKEMLQKLKLGTLDFSQPSTIMSTVVPAVRPVRHAVPGQGPGARRLHRQGDRLAGAGAQGRGRGLQADRGLGERLSPDHQQRPADQHARRT